MGRMMKKSREQIVQECADAATACYQHYSDNPLSQEARAAIRKTIDDALPEEISTKTWGRYADEKQAEYEAENDDIAAWQRSQK